MVIFVRLLIFLRSDLHTIIIWSVALIEQVLEEIETAIKSSVNAFAETKKMPIYERVEKLSLIIDDLRTNKEEFAQIICEEAGKAIITSRGEAERAVMTFTNALEECKRIGGEYLPLDYEASAKNRWGDDQTISDWTNIWYFTVQFSA